MIALENISRTSYKIVRVARRILSSPLDIIA
jgi:hypothetical protein